MRLTVIGCTGSMPGPSSPASCYLVEADDDAGRTWRVLLDLGSGAIGTLQQYLPVEAVDAVLLSHLHPDHCADLCGLYVARKYAPREQPLPRLPVHGPEGTLERIVLAYGGDATSGTVGAVYDVRAWDDGPPVRVGPFTVTARRVQHPIPAFGLRLEAAGRVLAYSGDTDACVGLDAVAQDADVLLAEAAFEEGRDTVRGVHLTGRRAGEAAAKGGAGRLVLTHLPPWTRPDVVTAEAREVYDGPVDVAAPGLVVEV